MMLANKKAMMSPSIVLLLIMTIVLVTVSLVMFGFKEKTIEKKLDLSGITKAYAEAEILDFYLNQISDSISYDEDPVEQFKNELGKYKNSEGKYFNDYLIEIEKQVDDEHVYFLDKDLIVNFSVKISRVISNPEDVKELFFEIDYIHNYYYKGNIAD